MPNTSGMSDEQVKDLKYIKKTSSHSSDMASSSLVSTIAKSFPVKHKTNKWQSFLLLLWFFSCSLLQNDGGFFFIIRLLPFSCAFRIHFCLKNEIRTDLLFNVQRAIYSCKIWPYGWRIYIIFCFLFLVALLLRTSHTLPPMSASPCHRYRIRN